MSGPHAPPASAADLAERALIGALLWDASRVRDVRDWLRPDDLAHWQARAIYETLLGLEGEGRRVPVAQLPAVIGAGAYHASRPGAITAVDLHGYLRATPATPPASAQFPAARVRSHHVIYARQVLEAAVRRAVTATGARIQQATEHSRAHPDLGAGGITAALAATQHRLAELTKRLHDAQGSSAGLIIAALRGPVADPPAAQTDTIWPGPPAAPLTTRAILEAERDILAGCLTDPTLRAELTGWLTAGDFSRPAHAATWAAFDALIATGTPIDYVTLAWQCQRHHPDYHSPGLPAAALATMAAHTPGLSSRSVATVAQASLLRHTDTARTQIQALVDNRDVDALTVVSAAQQAYRHVEHHAHRLSGATPAVHRAKAALTPTPAEPPLRGPTTTPTRPPPPTSSPPDHRCRR